jgi:hypothetical protein
LEGARELYAAYRAAGMRAEDFQGRKFTRLKQLKYLIGTGRLDDSLRWKRENSNAQPDFMPLLWQR